MIASPAAADAQPLRVLTFLHSFAPGGVERVALRLHGAWRASNVDSRLVMGRESGAMRAEWPGLEAEILGPAPFSPARWQTLWMILRLPGVIRRIRPDVLFCAGNTYTVVAVMMKLLLRDRCPPVVAKMSNDLVRLDMSAPMRAAYRVWLRVQGRMLDRLVGMAPPMREEIAALMRAAPERIAIIDDPSLDEADVVRLEQARRAAQSLPRGAGRRFVAIGRLTRQKNFALMIDAFALIARPQDHLVIVGEGAERAALEAQIARLGLGAQVRLPGHLHPVDSELCAGDALVLSSDYEGVPAVVAEALAAGLPVVATDCSVSMADILGAGRFGLLVPTGDTAALAAAMERIAALPFDVVAAQDQARRFTLQLASRRYIALMESAARE
ncbi:glycosyltransferase [Novosphingobium sp. Chol11]|uniref:glycosyltransferase n=1 Tax=Novosphingobium sp. Chol11 TaxID=1385763 RepID=UPI0025D9D25C|nr:glycosyltransferase [Novosphingobium sp. Chol11]